MRLVLILTLIAFCSIVVNAMMRQPSVTCLFESDTWTQIYGCSVHGIIVYQFSGKSVQKTNDDAHKHGKNSRDVKFVKSEGKKLKVFPNFSKVFINLEELSLKNAGLKQITKEDLKPYGSKLKNLDLSYNEIEFLEKNLFIYNPNLVEIIFNNNKIRHVMNGAFNNIPKVERLWFEPNPCEIYTSDTPLNGNYGIEFASAIEHQCKDKIFNRIDVLENEMVNLKREIATLKRNQE